MKSVINSGQTGVEVIALGIASDYKIETGGVAPYGYGTNDEPMPELVLFGLTEHEQRSSIPAIRENVANADAILLICADEADPHVAQVLKTARKLRKAVYKVVVTGEKLENPVVSAAGLSIGVDTKVVAAWLKNVDCVNITGNTAEACFQIDKVVRPYLDLLFKELTGERVRNSERTTYSADRRNTTEVRTGDSGFAAERQGGVAPEAKRPDFRSL